MKKKRGKRTTPSAPVGLPYLARTVNRLGGEYLYYRRNGRRIPLVQPEGSEGFKASYEAAAAQFDRPVAKSPANTVQDAITAYLASADYAQLRPGTRAQYRRTLDLFRAEFGAFRLAALTEPWIEALRADYIATPIAWNALRSRMIEVVRLFRRMNAGALAANPWEASKRLKVATSTAHRPWPPSLLLAVLRAATPEFRALLTGYLLTAQRGGDVTRLARDQYDPAAQTLTLAQEKTAEPLRLHVPTSLARVLEASHGRHATRLFVTPRGKPWTLANAQETLARLLIQIGQPRYTLHGLRATGPVALKMLGFENRALRSLTGHTSDQNLEVYLRGVDHYPLAKVAQEALAVQFGAVLELAEQEGNARGYSGVTGRAAAGVGRAIAKPIANTPEASRLKTCK